MLVGAACGEVVRGKSIRRSHAWAAGAVIALLPDMDSIVLLSLGQSAAAHGFYTHTLLAVAVVTAVAWAVGGTRWGMLAGAAYASHLLVDLLRDGSTTSVFLLGPFLATAAPPLAPLFPTIPFEWGESFGPLPGLYGEQPLQRLLLQTLIGAAIFVAAIVARELIRSRSRLRSLLSRQ